MRLVATAFRSATAIPAAISGRQPNSISSCNAQQQRAMKQRAWTHAEASSGPAFDAAALLGDPRRLQSDAKSSADDDKEDRPAPFKHLRVDTSYKTMPRLRPARAVDQKEQKEKTEQLDEAARDDSLSISSFDFELVSTELPIASSTEHVQPPRITPAAEEAAPRPQSHEKEPGFQMSA